MKYPRVWKTREFDDILHQHCNAVYNQNAIDKWTKGCSLPFPKKGELGIAKNYQGVTLTSKVAKIYYALLCTCREPKIEKILKKNQNYYFNIVTGVLQGDALAPYQFIICLDYVLRTSMDLMKENSFKLAKERNGRYPTQTIVNADNANDIALLANTPAQAESMQHSLE